MRRLFQFLLGSFPPAFRERFGPEIVDEACKEVEASRAAGSISGSLTLIATCIDLVRTGLAERWRPVWPAGHRTKHDHEGGTTVTRPTPRTPTAMWLDGVRGSFRGGFRHLRRHPAFAGLAVATLALGIGATTAMFAVVSGVLLAPLPYPDESELVSVGLSAPGIDQPSLSSAPFLHFTYAEESRAFERVALTRTLTATVTGRGQAHPASALTATPDLLPLLGIEPISGRGFTAEDAAPASPATVLLSHGFWQGALGGDPTVIGRGLTVDGRTREVIGVLPPDFSYLDQPVDLILPYQFDRRDAWLGGFGFESLARLRPGVSMQEATADVARMIDIAIATTPPSEGASREAFAERLDLRPNLSPLRDEVIGGLDRILWVLTGAIALLLVIACANVANLILVRAEARRLDLNVRAALGASRGRITRDMVAEGIMIGGAGGLLGALAAALGLPALLALAPDLLPRAGEIAVDPEALAFAGVLSVGCGAFLGLLPAFKHARDGTASALRGGTRSMTPTRERQRALGTLVVVQVAFSLVLLIGSGLMIRTYVALNQVDPGFDDPEEIQVARIAVPTAAVPDAAAVARMQDDIMRRIAALPGVTAVGLGSAAPMEPVPRASESLSIEGREFRDEGAPALRRFEFVSPRYFETVGTELLAGEAFSTFDVETRRPVAIVSRTLARQEWGSAAGAIGRRIRSSADEPWRQIVGVVQDVYDYGPHQPAEAVVYLPTRMTSFWGQADFVQRETALVVRSPVAGSEAFVRALHDAVWGVDPDLPLTGVRTLSEIQARMTARHSFALTLLAAAGAIAFFMGIVGLYGVLAYSASRRQRELGLRMALGAQPAELQRMLIWRGVWLTGIGVFAGIAIAAFGSRFLSSLLFETRPVDPATYAGVSVILLAASVAAAYGPARRATRLGPTVAMWEE